MATIAVEVLTEKITSIASESGSETGSVTVIDALSNNVRASPAKESALNDSGISSSRSNCDVSGLLDTENIEQKDSNTCSQSENFQRVQEHSVDNRCSQESKGSSLSERSNVTSTSRKSESTSSKHSGSCSDSTLKEDVKNNDEDSRSSLSSSTSTIKDHIDRTDDSDSRSSFKSSIRKSSPEKHSQNKSSQSVCTNVTEDNDSRSSFTSSHSRSTAKNSQPVSNISDNESCSRSSSRQSSPTKQSQKSSPNKKSQQTNSSLSQDNDSRSSLKSSQSEPRSKRNQSSSDSSDDESRSRSSFSSTRRSSPEKKKSQSVKPNNSDDENSQSSVTSSNSKSTTKSSQHVIDKLDDGSMSRASSQSCSTRNSPEKNNDNEKKPKKYFSIIDSDSEDEITLPQKSKRNEKHSDSDTIVSEIAKSPKGKKSKKTKHKKKKKIFDSDSDESVKSSRSTKINQSDSEKGSDSDNEDMISKPINKSNKISNIVDSDSENSSGSDSKRVARAVSEEENDTGKLHKENKKREKKRMGSARASKDAAMQQIHSETQRLIRESGISLPYHRPKQRTLQEFLNRKKITSEIPKNLTFAEKVKMFPEIISKVVEEKEKEAEIFYKSSDSEDEKSDKMSEPMEVDQAETKNEVGNSNEIGNTSSEDIMGTQKLTQDDIQESHNKISILQKRSTDFGVPRKLFMEDAVAMEESEIDEASQTCKTDDIEVVKKQNREVKTGLQEFSVPQKSSMVMDVDDDITDIHMSANNIESEKKDSLEISGPSEKSIESTETKSTHENSTEDFVLNMSDTDLDTNYDKKNESEEIRDLQVPSKDPESIKISETPVVNNKEVFKLNQTSTNQQTDQDSQVTPATKPINTKIGSPIKNTHKNTGETEEEDSIFKIADKTNAVDDEDGIIDRNVLRDDFGLPPELDEPAEKSNVKQKVLADALKSRPTIRASPGSMIDLTADGGGQMKEGTSRLLDRFVKHSTARKAAGNGISEIKIIRTEGEGDNMKIIEEILPFKKDVLEEDPKKDRKPGEKYVKLREHLKQKMAIARYEEWKHKEEIEKEAEEECDKGKGDDFYANLPDEEELLEDEESAESEPEEDDVPIVENRKPKSAFVDEEAEESFDEDAENIGENEEECAGEVDEDEDEENDEEDNEEDDEEDDEEEDEENDQDEESEKEEETSKGPKRLRRIVKPFEDDSNDTQSSLSNDAKQSNDPKQSSFERSKTDEDMFATLQPQTNGYASEDIETDSMPLFQRDRCGSDSRSQACKTPLPKPFNALSMVSPVAHLTALNTSYDSASKSGTKNKNLEFEQSASKDTPSEDSNRPTTSCSLEKMIGLQKKLFEDPPDTVNEDELLEVCSGEFADTQNSERSKTKIQHEVTDSQLMAVCSGAFDTQSTEMKKPLSNNTVPHNVDETSQDITLTLDDDDDECSKSNYSKTQEYSRSCSSTKRSDESMFSSDSSVKLSSSSDCVFKNPMDKWLKKATEKSRITQKYDKVTESQLMDICSGSFPSQALDMKELEKDDSSSKSRNESSTSRLQQKPHPVTDSQLMNICSGAFDSQPIDTKDLEKNDSPVKLPSLMNPMDTWLQKFPATQTETNSEGITDSQLMDICSGDFSSQPLQKKDLEVDDTVLICDASQLTPDDYKSSQIQKSQKLTESRMSDPSLKKKVIDEDESIVPRTMLKIVSSSDEDEQSKGKHVKRKKKLLKRKQVQKLVLSDDEDENSNEYCDEEESEYEEEEDEEHFIEYDSDENEIVVPKREIKKVAKKFLENEAELSESEWGSADEDEEDLDKLEAEEGDAEDIDEDQVKNQLDKIHMQQMMDKDSRQVKMLQELLFDDGDLHSDGAGRERKFKWKNIDDLGDLELGPRMDDNGELMDDEDDTEMELGLRKIRYERQKFLEDKEKNVEEGLDDEFTESQLGNLGMKVVSVRTSSKSTEVSTMSKFNSEGSNMPNSNGVTSMKKTVMSSRSFSFSNVRGSFLSRGDDTLIRIAQNLPEKSKVAVSAARTKNFVFARLSPSVSKHEALKGDSEQENDVTSAKEKNKRKRKMLSSQQTPRSTKKLKTDERTAGKKLF